ncbi:vesicle coat component [Gonapodya sp. JEL0774]|nr:vesicle coat component [Gonapodya sp. JEL0774]
MWSSWHPPSTNHRHRVGSDSKSSLPRLLHIIFAALILFISSIHAVKFELEGYHAAGVPNRRCLSQFVGRNVLVAGKIWVGPGTDQRIDIEIRDNSPHSNQYFKKGDANNDLKFSFTTHSHADVEFCFSNVLRDGVQPHPALKRDIHLQVEVGIEAEDMSEIAKTEKLRPAEVELRRMEGVVKEIVEEMEAMKEREAKMRDTNESTNDRVKYFSILSIVVLIALGVWQIWYLRRFFQTKKLVGYANVVFGALLILQLIHLLFKLLLDQI